MLCHHLIKKIITIKFLEIEEKRIGTSFRKPTLVDSKERFSWISGQQQCSRQKKKKTLKALERLLGWI